MEFEFKVEDRKDHALVILPEKVIIPHSEYFKPAMEEAYRQGHSTIVLDCTNLQMFDTAGITNLAVYQKKQRARGGEVKLINVTDDYIKELFRIIELNKLVTIEEI